MAKRTSETLTYIILAYMFWVDSLSTPSDTSYIIDQRYRFCCITVMHLVLLLDQGDLLEIIRALRFHERIEC